MANIEQIKQHLNLLNDDELVAILQEHDESEWQPEVFGLVRAILNDRGVSPEAYIHNTEEPEMSEETFELVTVGSYTSYLDAETDRLALETKEIKAWVLDELSPLAEGMNPGIRLQVRADDVAAAMQILEAEPIPSSDLPEDIAEPPCPKCGSRSVMEKADVPEAEPATSTIWMFVCASCGHKWEAN